MFSPIGGQHFVDHNKCAYANARQRGCLAQIDDQVAHFFLKLFLRDPFQRRVIS
jgi:hypothetical protein